MSEDARRYHSRTVQQLSQHCMPGKIKHRSEIIRLYYIGSRHILLKAADCVGGRVSCHLSVNQRPRQNIQIGETKKDTSSTDFVIFTALCIE